MEQYKQQILLICDHAFIDNQGKLNIIGVFENINLQKVPGNLLKMVIVGSYLLSNPNNKQTKLEINLLKPDQSLLIHVQKDEAKLHNDRILNFMITLENMKFELLGEHKLEILINGMKAGEQTINVKRLTN